GTYPKMTPEVYNAVIAEAHAHHMMVHAHAIAMADQKSVVRAGADVLVHTVQNEKLDDELIALLREKKPYWTTVIGLGDRSEACGLHRPHRESPRKHPEYAADLGRVPRGRPPRSGGAPGALEAVQFEPIGCKIRR